MTEHRIFKPDIILQDYIKSSWSTNVKTIDGKLPISQFLKTKGIWGLEISPLQDKEWYCFGLPVNKNWETEVFTQEMELSFSVYTENKLFFEVMFQDSKKVNSKPFAVSVNKSTDDKIWTSVGVISPIKDIRLILFSGSSKTSDFVIKDIILKTP